MSKAASLTSGLVARKGQAMPAVVASMPVAPVEVKPAAPMVVAPVAVAEAAAPDAPAKATNGAVYYKALTVKLDRARYEALKSAGIKQDKKSQEIFVEALDAYLAKLG